MSVNDTQARWLAVSLPDIRNGVASRSVIDLACSIAGGMVQEGTVSPEGLAMLRVHAPEKLQLELNL